MELTITVRDDTRQLLEARARARGFRSVTQYVEQLVTVDALAAESFDTILGPMRAAFQASGVSESEMDAEFEAARDEVYRARSQTPVL